MQKLSVIGSRLYSSIDTGHKLTRNLLKRPLVAPVRCCEPTACVVVDYRVLYRRHAVALIARACKMCLHCYSFNVHDGFLSVNTTD